MSILTLPKQQAPARVPIRAHLLHLLEQMLLICAFEEIASVKKTGRLGGADVPIPYNRNLERAAIPQVEDIAAAAHFLGSLQAALEHPGLLLA